MKYIEKKYQELIAETERAYDNTCDTLRYHINELQKIIAEKDDEIEKLKGASQLQNEIDEYNRLEAQNNMNLEDEIVELKAKIGELRAENIHLKKAYSDLEKAYKITVDTPAPAKKTGRKAGSKNKYVVAYCKDCGTYFQAKSKNAKYCSACGQKRAKQSRAKWLAKQKKQK